MAEHPRLLQTVLDATRPGEPAEFYRRLLGLTYRPGDEPPAAGVPDEPDWLVLRDPEGPTGRPSSTSTASRGRRGPTRRSRCSCTSISRSRTRPG